MHSSGRVFAVVPAAGRGTRMQAIGPQRAESAPAPQKPKQLCDLHGQPMLLRVIEAIRQSRASGCVVVVNPEIVPELEAWSGDGDDEIQYVVNPRPQSEMIESIQMGLRAAAALAGFSQRVGFIGNDGFIICPGDHPCITPQIMDHCIASFEADPSRIVVATHAGRRGHPLVLPSDLAFEVLSWAPGRGLNEVLWLHGGRVFPLELPDPGVLVDVDTAADLERARDQVRMDTA